MNPRKLKTRIIFFAAVWFGVITRHQNQQILFNNDGTIDVIGGNVKIGTATIPIKFNYVTGDFDGGLKLKSLKGAPKYVGGDFICNSPHLKSLVGGPIEVGGHYDVGGSGISSLEGAPKEVGKRFVFRQTVVTKANGLPFIVGGGIEGPRFIEWRSQSPHHIHLKQKDGWVYTANGTRLFKCSRPAKYFQIGSFISTY